MVQDKIYEIEKMIHFIRDQKVMLDYDLAKLYQVETKVLNQAVKRNIVRFPEDFMFSLYQNEINELSQKGSIMVVRENLLWLLLKMGLLCYLVC